MSSSSLSARTLTRVWAVVAAVVLAALVGSASVAPAHADAAATTTQTAAIRRVQLTDGSEGAQTLADRQGNVWSLGEFGINRIHDGGVDSYDRVPTGRACTEFAVDSLGGAWVDDFDLTSNAQFVTNVAADGHLTDVPVHPFSILVAGPEGTAWLIGNQGGVQRVARDGTVTVFDTAQITEYAIGGDGTFWFGAIGAVGWISPTQMSTTAGTDALSGAGSSMIVAANGSVWFGASNHIDVITPSHVLTEFTVPNEDTPSNLVEGADGNVWFETGSIPPSVGRVTPSGHVTVYPLGIDRTDELGNMVLGPGGNIWLSLQTPGPGQALGSSDYVVRITPAGQLTEYLTSLEEVRITLFVSPNGTLWYQSQPNGPGSPGIGPTERYTATVSSDGTVHDLADTGTIAGGVAFDSEGHAWTLDYDTRTLFEFLPVTTSRVSAPDRFGTSVAIAKENYPSAAPVVFVASGTNYPDALSAGPAAAAMHGPLLLTAPTALPQNVADEIASLAPQKIVVIGGPSAVSDAVLSQLQRVAPTSRVFGADRYETSRAIVQNFFPSGASNAYLATGTNFPDALAAGAAAGASGDPLLLVYGLATTVDAPTATLLKHLKVTRLTIAGGTTAITPALAAQLGTIAPATRVAGADRFDTAAAINEAAYSTPGPVQNALIATGLNFPDALAASAWAAATKSPLFVSMPTCVPARALGDLVDRNAAQVTIVGGTSAVSSAVDELASC